MGRGSIVGNQELGGEWWGRGQACTNPLSELGRRVKKHLVVSGCLPLKIKSQASDVGCFPRSQEEILSIQPLQEWSQSLKP